MLKDKRLFLFDIDGTLALGDNLFEGTKELLNFINEIGGKSVFITNNSTKSIKDYIKKFDLWGIKTKEDNFITASYITCLYIKENYENKKVFALGTKSFINELKEANINVTTKPEEDVSCVLVGFDDELNYQKLMDACELLQRDDNIDFIATNPDLACPYTFGFIPDCGAISKMIALTISREPIFIGKPNKAIVELSLKDGAYSREEVLVVGDRMYTDILCGINAGVDTCLVLTGEASLESLKEYDYKPKYIFETIKDLYEALV